MNGLNVTERASAPAAARTAARGMDTPPISAAMQAIMPSAHDVECCGLYQSARISPSMRSRPQRHAATGIDIQVLDEPEWPAACARSYSA